MLPLYRLAFRSVNASFQFVLDCGIAFVLLISGVNFVSASQPTYATRISALIQASPELQQAHIGYLFVDADSGKVLAERNSSQFFTPASNRKLYVTALALFRLGPGYRFKTDLCTDQPWRPGQTVLRDLELVGGGDPNLSGRVLPYSANAHDQDPLAVIHELADKVASYGIREIDGDVIGIADRYAGDRVPLDWTLDDSMYGYGAPVSALTIDDNTTSITVSPTEPGELAAIETSPNLDYFIILNQVITNRSSTTELHARRLPGSNELILWGTIGKQAKPWKQDFAIDDPALFAAEALIAALEERGITVRGMARSHYIDPNSSTPSPAAPSQRTVLASHESQPLWEDIQVINKVSENLHAEMLLREVGLIQNGLGTLTSGLDAEKTFLQQAGLYGNPPPIAFFDGCGLARQDLTTPASIVALLRYMWQSPYRDLWLQTLPIGGVDGTLQNRFQGIFGAQRVHAKTGTVEHVRALSGYIETFRHRWIAFSILVNSASVDGSEITKFIDQVCSLFLEH
jgi:D-alanyl-D-alanine carboxypeptidase/D-alanyl-D-alanine-endopeptidase (penicillin-binding protein 4)